jgi:cell division protein FtsZ
VAETIRAAEIDMERELEIAVTQPLMRELEQPAQSAQDAFRPASRLFSTPAPEPMQMQQRPAQPAPQPMAPIAEAQPAPMQMRAPVAPAPAPQLQPAPQMRAEPSLMSQVRSEAESHRMPKVEDFSPVVKAEIEHRSSPVAQAHAEERGPMGLLKRLTSSLSRREDEPAAPSDMTSGAPAASSQQRRPLSPEASLYAPRRGNLDDLGRAAPSQPRSQEEELDIPAFLRRQSN